MAKGYVILTEDIHDPVGMSEYGKAAAASMAKHQGKVLVLDENVAVLEGKWHGTRTIIVEYESVDAARAWYESPEYAAAAPLRHRAATCNVAILSGFPTPGRSVGGARPS